MQVIAGERFSLAAKQTVRLKRMLVDVGRGRQELRLVLSIGGHSLLTLLNAIYMYAVVDTWSLLPVLLLINVIALRCAMSEPCCGC